MNDCFAIVMIHSVTHWLTQGLSYPKAKGQRTHVLRHTFASHFIMNGGNLLTLQKILGHQTINMMMRYAHLAPDHLSEAVTYNPISKLRF